MLTHMHSHGAAPRAMLAEASMWQAVSVHVQDASLPHSVTSAPTGSLLQGLRALRAAARIARHPPAVVSSTRFGSRELGRSGVLIYVRMPAALAPLACPPRRPHSVEARTDGAVPSSSGKRAGGHAHKEERMGTYGRDGGSGEGGGGVGVGVDVGVGLGDGGSGVRGDVEEEAGEDEVGTGLGALVQHVASAGFFMGATSDYVLGGGGSEGRAGAGGGDGERGQYNDIEDPCQRVLAVVGFVFGWGSLVGTGRCRCT